MKLIAITTGDSDGIGFEVTAKALSKIGPQANTQFLLFRQPQSEVLYLPILDKKFNRIVVPSLEAALSLKNQDSKTLFDICSKVSAPKNVEIAAKACFKKKIHGLVTAPLSKTLIQSSGYRAKGHTEILQNVSKTKNVHMTFIGKNFNVLLATGHMPVAKVSASLNVKTLQAAIQNADLLKKILPPKIANKPIALVGLNPHAGENGLLGQEEILTFKKVLKKFPSVLGPLVPDAAFLKKNWPLYSVYICCYHDQGLIPFKLVHGTQSGYHLTLGLPFVRTSVDHGTAKDIFGKNQADASSMKEAILACIQLAK